MIYDVSARDDRLALMMAGHPPTGSAYAYGAEMAHHFSTPYALPELPYRYVLRSAEFPYSITGTLFVAGIRISASPQPVLFP